MILKVFRGVWFLSLMAAMANLMYVYAGLPEQVVVQEEGINTTAISKETVFYVWLAVLGIVNVLVYVFGKKLVPSEALRTWFTGLIICLNLFFIIAFSFIGLYNSSESFDFSRAGIVLYISLGLVVAWIVGGAIYGLVKRFSS
ncbi:MAG: hypothetical protein KF803_14385 [Cyclobacteriaceae bacterium]|nr:hypothetical protein [Cyclobacteriaceae bacterium]